MDEPKHHHRAVNLQSCSLGEQQPSSPLQVNNHQSLSLLDVSPIKVQFYRG